MPQPVGPKVIEIMQLETSHTRRCSSTRERQQKNPFQLHPAKTTCLCWCLAWRKSYGKKIIDYPAFEGNDQSDLVAEAQLNLFFNNGQNERQEEETLRVLSLFSGAYNIPTELSIIRDEYKAEAKKYLLYGVKRNITRKDGTIIPQKIGGHYDYLQEN